MRGGSLYHAAERRYPDGEDLPDAQAVTEIVTRRVHSRASHRRSVTAVDEPYVDDMLGYFGPGSAGVPPASRQGWRARQLPSQALVPWLRVRHDTAPTILVRPLPALPQLLDAPDSLF